VKTAAALAIALTLAGCTRRAPVRPVRFIVTGDAGATHSQLRRGILAEQKRAPIDGIVLTGDNFYPCGVNGLADPQWSKITEHFGPARVPIYPVLGNHDYGDPHARGGAWALCGHPDPGAEVAESARLPQWRFPARNYVVHTAGVDLIMIDTQPIASALAAPLFGSMTAAGERQWIERALAASDAPWKFVVGHHTIFSSGVHGRTDDAERRRMRDLLPLLRRYGVNAYICGHDHDMELIGGAPFFLVSGAGSGLDVMKRRRATDEPPTLYPPFPSAPYLGFAVLEVGGQGASITFFDAEGKRTSKTFSVSSSP
jgi:acid phosphatase